MRRISFSLHIILTLTSQTNAQRNFGDACSEIQTNVQDIAGCSPYQSLACQDGVCACDISYANITYDVKRGMCIFPLDSECNPNHQNVFFQCGRSASCVSHRPRKPACQCYPDRTPTNDGINCAIKWNEPCEKDYECETESLLKCISGRCNCPNPFENYYDAQSAICRVHVGATCTPGNVMTCDPGANCVPLRQPGIQQMSSCECSSQYPISLPEVRTDFGVYNFPGYYPCVNVIRRPGDRCDSNRSGNGTELLRNICDGRAQLTCDGEVCRCMQGLQWDQRFSRCAAREGGSCFIPINENRDYHSRISVEGVEPSSFRAVRCITGLQCVITKRTAIGNKGICAI